VVGSSLEQKGWWARSKFSRDASRPDQRARDLGRGHTTRRHHRRRYQRRIVNSSRRRGHLRGSRDKTRPRTDHHQGDRRGTTGYVLGRFDVKASRLPGRRSFPI